MSRRHSNDLGLYSVGCLIQKGVQRGLSFSYSSKHDAKQRSGRNLMSEKVNVGR